MYRQSSQMNKIFPIHLKIKLSVIYYTTWSIANQGYHMEAFQLISKEVLYKCVDGLHNSIVQDMSGQKGTRVQIFFISSQV